MRNISQLITHSHPLTRIDGKPRLVVRKHPNPRTRSVIPARIDYVSTLCFVALPEVVVRKLKPSAQAALVDWLHSGRMHLLVEHKDHHFTLTLTPVALTGGRDSKPKAAQATAAGPKSQSGK